MSDLKQSGQWESAVLYDKLAAYGKSDFYPYHMPGHKRSRSAGALSEFFQIDITEIDGFDNLHQAKGLIRQAQERAAKLYGAEESYFLINGSTCGVLAAISAVTDKQDCLLIARNCHKSVYHAAFLQELHLRYLYPRQIVEYDILDAVSPGQVETALEAYPACRAVMITSPTYEGILSDIEGIAEIVHARNKVLIVDEAHGAHLGLAEGLPENSVKQGADLVIHSLHKTLPSMTQTALLHVSGPLVNRKKLRRYLSIYQSSSPSYVLMASMDAAISYVIKNSPDCFQKMQQYYQDFMLQMRQCRHIRIGDSQTIQEKGYCYYAWDICKLVISVKGTFMSGQRLYDILRNEFHLQMEMAAGSYVLAIMTIADKKEGWQRLADALLQIDGRQDIGSDGETSHQSENGIDFAMKEKEDPAKESVTFYTTKAKMTISQALYAVQENGREIPLSQAEGKIAGEFINLYPPGVPILVPGEVIETDRIRQIEGYLRAGLHVQGVSSEGSVIIC